MANRSALWVVVIMATVLAIQPGNALLGLGGGGGGLLGGGGLGGLLGGGGLGGLLGGGGGGGGGGGVVGGVLPGLNNCDPTKLLMSCATPQGPLKVLPPSQACCSTVSSLLSCFCNMDSSFQQLLSGTVGQALSIACGTSVPTCT